MHQLNPKLNREKWDIEDSKNLFILHKKFKNRWKNIAENFAGRTDNSIKNQFFSVVRKALRKACKVLGNISNTSTINKIKPKVLSSYLSMDFEINISGNSQNHLKVSLSDFVQKFAFTKYTELVRYITSDDLLIIEKCIDFLSKLNESYMIKKNTKCRSDKQAQVNELTSLENQNVNEANLNHKLITDPRLEDSQPQTKNIDHDQNKMVNNKISEDVSRLFESLQTDLNINQNDNQNLIDRLIQFFKGFGDLSYDIVNMLSNEERNQNGQTDVTGFLEKALKIQRVLESDSSEKARNAEPEANLNIFTDFWDKNTTPRVIQTLRDDLKESKFDDIIKKPTNNPYSPLPGPFTPQNKSNMMKIPKLCFNPNTITSLSRASEESDKFNMTPSNKSNKPKNFPNILLRLKGNIPNEPGQGKRPFSMFKTSPESNFETKNQLLENPSLVDLSTLFLINNKDEVFGPISKKLQQ